MLKVEGRVKTPSELSVADLAAIDQQYQVADISPLIPGRTGTAVTLVGLLSIIEVEDDADYIGLHASTDDFHASVPLKTVLDRGLLVYSQDGEPLTLKAGGPYRFYIRDFAACHADEVDECANLKFLDRIELTAGKGFDNRPSDDEQHAKLHQDQAVEHGE